MNFPPHACSLTLTHNPHKDIYMNLEEYLGQQDDSEWESTDDRKIAIETNEIWELQWYPRTPNGFYKVAASSLEVLIKLANSLDAQ